MKHLIQKAKRRLKRKLRIRETINGVASKPRLSVFRSNKHFSVQAIDDVAGVTLASISDLQKEFSTVKVTVEGIKVLGKAFAEKLKAAKISEAVFDRNGYRYHGVIKEFADAVRENGIKI